MKLPRPDDRLASALRAEPFRSKLREYLTVCRQAEYEALARIPMDTEFRVNQGRVSMVNDLLRLLDDSRPTGG